MLAFADWTVYTLVKSYSCIGGKTSCVFLDALPRRQCICGHLTCSRHPVASERPRHADRLVEGTVPLAQQLMCLVQLMRQHKHATRAALGAGCIRPHMVQDRLHRAQRITLAHGPVAKQCRASVPLPGRKTLNQDLRFTFTFTLSPVQRVLQPTVAGISTCQQHVGITRGGIACGRT